MDLLLKKYCNPELLLFSIKFGEIFYINDDDNKLQVLWWDDLCLNSLPSKKNANSNNLNEFPSSISSDEVNVYPNPIIDGNIYIV